MGIFEPAPGLILSCGNLNLRLPLLRSLEVLVTFSEAGGRYKFVDRYQVEDRHQVGGRYQVGGRHQVGDRYQVRGRYQVGGRYQVHMLSLVQ